MEIEKDWEEMFEEMVVEGKTTHIEMCSDPECMTCAIRDCPLGEPLHYHHDGCPACSTEREDFVKIKIK